MGRETPDASGGFRGHKKNEGRQYDFYQVTYKFYRTNKTIKTVCLS